MPGKNLKTKPTLAVSFLPGTPDLFPRHFIRTQISERDLKRDGDETSRIWQEAVALKKVFRIRVSTLLFYLSWWNAHVSGMSVVFCSC